MLVKSFKEYKGHSYSAFPPGWGHKSRRALFYAACKHLKINPKEAENIFKIGFHSVLHSNTIELKGNILSQVKNDSAFLMKHNGVINKIKNNSVYAKEPIDRYSYFSVQLGGSRAKDEMWKQALYFWRWASGYSATWKMAFSELTWSLRSVKFQCKYEVNKIGDIQIKYSFEDFLDLRPDWDYRSYEYNAACVVLGFLYHDVIGGNDKLILKGSWTYNEKGPYL